ncbi:MAG: phosphoribosylamine--glycine ligase [Synergistaceae bacterium]|nr:phosphoribosylamine--glycine ligase [Synergistaceae bacterium]
MKVMVLGGGGREHAVVHAFSKSNIVTQIHCCPGNPGIAKLAVCHDGDPCKPGEMTALCRRLGIDLVFVGPEAPLVAGTADALRKAGILVMGPGKLGAQLEGSKAFSKQFMVRHGIPTSAFDCCNNMDACRRALEKRSAPYVVKADGLAAGKGAFLTDTFEDAMTVCSIMLEDMLLGPAGRTIVIEDFVEGQEMTVLAVTDGETVRILPSSQDHKRALDGDKGNNTGGMGAYSPVPWVDEAFLKKISDKVMMPTLNGLKSDGIPFCGIIYAGLMVKPDGSLSVLEYNVRLGDPEAQVVLPVFEGDFGEVILACCKGDLAKVEWPDPRRYALGVVMASGGYPDKYETGVKITFLQEDIPDTYVYHAGTSFDANGDLVTSGGRVFTVVGIADTLQAARDLAYKRVKTVHFLNAHYRNDIGDKSLKGACK